MKKQLVKAMALCCATLALGSCEKDRAPGVEQSHSLEQVDHPIERLRTFRGQLEAAQNHPGVRSSETLSLSDALWDVENHFNLTYTDTEQYYSEINEHEFTLFLPVSETQEVTVGDAVDLYGQVVDQARQALASDAFDEKGFISLNIKNTQNEENGLRIEFSGKTGERSSHSLPTAYIDGPFGNDDNWMFAAPMGKCDDPDIPSGADKEIQEKLYAAIIDPQPEAEPGYRNIYINRQRFYFDGTNYQNVYYTQDLNDLCIEYHDMNRYFQGEKTVITQTIPQVYHLMGYSPISIEITGASLEQNTAVTHHNEVEYGTRMQVRIDEFGEIEDLLQ